MTATDAEPTTTQLALLQAAIAAIQSRHTELTGHTITLNDAQHLVIAALPYLQNFVIDVEVSCIADNARIAADEVGIEPGAWRSGYLEGWAGAVESLRRRAAARVTA